MAIKLCNLWDPREELKTNALWIERTPLKLALLGRGLVVPDYVNLECQNAPEAQLAEAVADIQKLQFPPLSVSEILLLEGLCRLEPAAAIAFISNCISWLNITTRFTVRVPAGNWSFPNIREKFTWSTDALIAVLDHFGILVDHVNKDISGGEEKVTVSGGNPERTVSYGAHTDLLQRLIEGPLCSLGCVPQELTEKFYLRCLGFLNKEASQQDTPGRAFQIPQVKPDRLQILHTVEFYAPHVGGAELVMKNISEKLAERGHSVTVATSYLPERNFDDLNGVHIQQFNVAGSTAMGITGTDAARYMRFVREFPYDVMMNYAAQQWATDLALPILPRLTNRVNIIAPCGYSAMSAPGKLRANEFYNYFQHTLPRTLVYADAVIFHSSMYQDYTLSQLLGHKNGVVIPNAVDEKEFEHAPEIHFREKYGIKERFLLLCVANFVEGKGQENLIEMLRKLDSKEIALALVGHEGPSLSKLRELAKGINVYFLVDIPRIDTVSAYFSSDLFVFTSQLEASPLVILEAKAARLPFVSTDVGNVKEWKGGVICPLKTMANEVIKLLTNPTQRSQLGLEGWKEYQEKHTWNAVLERYENLYFQLARSKQGRRSSESRSTPLNLMNVL